MTKYEMVQKITATVTMIAISGTDQEFLEIYNSLFPEDEHWSNDKGDFYEYTE